MSDSVPPADSVALNLIQFINNASVKMMRALSCVGTDTGTDVAASAAWATATPPTSLPPSHQHHRRLPAHGTQRGAGRTGRASESPPLRLSAREAAADPYGGVAARRRRRQRTPDGRAIRRAASAVGGCRTASTSSSSSSGSSDYSGGVGGVAYSSPRTADSPLQSGDDSVFDSLLVAGSIGAPVSGDPPASGSYGQVAFVPFNAPSTSPPVAGTDRSGRFGASYAQPTASVGDSCDAHYRLPTAMRANNWAPRAVQPLSASPLPPPQPACAQSDHFTGARWHPMSSAPTSSCDFADGGGAVGVGYYYAGDEGRWHGATNSSWYATSAGVIAGFRNFAHDLSSQPPPMAAAVGCVGSSVPLTSTCPDPVLPPVAVSAPPEPLAAPASAAAGWRPTSDASAASLDCAPSIGDMLDGLYDLLSDCATASSCAATRTCASAAPAALQASLFAQCA